jgi:hypothetical protein
MRPNRPEDSFFSLTKPRPWAIRWMLFFASPALLGWRI